MLSHSKRAHCLMLLAMMSLAIVPWSFAQTPEAMATAHRWFNAKFLGEASPNPPESYLLAFIHSGHITKNEVEGHHFRILDKDYTRGLHFPSQGDVRVTLSSPAKTFEAIVGVDSNDIGYYSNVGRGAVVASVDVGGKTPFRSDVMHEGMTGVPIKVDLDNATEFDLKIEDGGGGVVFGNDFDQADWADARVTLANGKTVWLGDLPTGPLRAAFAASVPFSFQYNDQPSHYLLKTWEFKHSVRDLDADRAEHTLTYTDPETGLEVRCVAVEYKDFPVTEWTLYFKNTGSEPTPILENIQAIDTRFERTQDGEFTLHHNKGSAASASDFAPLTDILERKQEKVFTARGGTATNLDLSYFNIALPGEGTIIGLGWPGQWSGHFTRDEGTGLQVRAGQELTHFKLLPGEEVRSPLVAVVFWTGDWIDGQNVWRRWMIAHNLPRPNGQLPAPLLTTGTNGYTIEQQGANEQNLKEFMQMYYDRGWKFDYWWMDAGWYPFKDGWWNVGTWEPDPKRFPQGFRPISDFAHQHGGKLLVWFEPERVTAGTWLWENHPDWLLGKGTDGGNKLLYYGNPDALKWAIDHFDHLLTEQGIDLYRQDFNFSPLDIWRENDAPDRQGITEIRHLTGYLAYWDALRSRHPGMLIDDCAGGGRRDDLETLRRAVPLWRSDYGMDEPIGQQNLTYGLAMWVPYFGTGIRTSNPYSFRSTMAMSIGTGPDPRSKNVDFPTLNKLAGQWRKIAPYYYGDYYPLTPYSTENSAWVAWQFNRPGSGDGVVQVFRRAESPIEKAQFKLRGLDAAAQYSVTNIDTPGETQISGGELQDKGLPVEVKDKPSAVVIFYKRVR